MHWSNVHEGLGHVFSVLSCIITCGCFGVPRHFVIISGKAVGATGAEKRTGWQQG